MKFQPMVVLILLACAQFARADDDAKSPPRSSSRPAPSTATTNAAPAPRPPQTVARRPFSPSTNPNLRPVNPYLNTTVQRHFSPIDPSRTIAPSNTPIARTGPNRTTVVTPNQRPNVTANNAVRSRTRLPGRTGNELSFAQAQAQNVRHRHDRDWWRHHNTRICFYGGGYWFWNAGWWFPAWGYSPYYNNYVYDGPIYGYGELPPGDVTAQVQEALAQQGYYYGAIDGVLGPETRDAILRFQADHGLATTAAIDEATLDTLGLT